MRAIAKRWLFGDETITYLKNMGTSWHIGYACWVDDQLVQVDQIEDWGHDHVMLHVEWTPDATNCLTLDLQWSAKIFEDACEIPL